MDEEERKVPEIPCPFIISAITELLGSFSLMFIGCMGCYDEFGIGPVIPSFAFAFAILIALQAFGAISPCHINPAISVGLFLLKEMTWKRFLIYVVAQYIGCLLGFGALYLCMPEHEDLCLLRLKDDMNVTQGFFLEFFGTFFLMIVVCGAAEDRINAELQDSRNLRISFAAAGIIISIAPFSGCGINPARSLPPALFYNNWTNHWYYEVAPILGGLAAALVYRFVLSSEEKYSLFTLCTKKGL